MESRCCRKGFAANSHTKKGMDLLEKSSQSLLHRVILQKSLFIFFQVLMAGVPGCDRCEWPEAVLGFFFSISSARWLPKIPLDYLKKTKSRKPTPLEAICSPSPAVYSIPPAQMVPVPSQPSPGTGGPHSSFRAGHERWRCRKPGRPERRLRGRSRALRGTAGSSSPAEGAARGRAGGY